MNSLYIPEIQLTNTSFSTLNERLKLGIEVELNLNDDYLGIDKIINEFQESHRRWFPYFIFCFDTGLGSTIKIKCDFRGFESGTTNMIYESIKAGRQLRVILKHK